MATDYFTAEPAPAELGVVQAALNGMDAIENLLCRMRNLALIAQGTPQPGERRALARGFDQLRRDLDFIAAGTLDIAKACGEGQISPAEYQQSSHAVIAVCEADGNNAWLRLSGLPPYCRFPAGDRRFVDADGDGNLELTRLDGPTCKNTVFDAIYDLLHGETVVVRSAIDMAVAVNGTSHPDLCLHIHRIDHGWGSIFGHAQAIERSLAQTSMALDGLHCIASSFGAYVYRLYQRYGFGEMPANDI